MYFCNTSFSTIVLAIFQRFFTYSICNFYAEALIFSTNASARQTFSRASFFPHGLVVVGGLRGELFIGICPAFISTFADHQRRALVHFFGLAKALQYSAVLVLGKAGGHRLRDWWRRRNFLASPTSQQSEETLKEKEEHQK